jgi:hypothetical protein
MGVASISGYHFSMKTLIWSITLAFLAFSPSVVNAKDIRAIYGALAPLGTAERLTRTTAFFIDTPSGLNPLGEGKGLDPGPLYSTNVFDCTTYVETNLAIALSKSLEEVPAVLNKIRYQNGEVDYFRRNHFMVSDWIPANTRFVTDITATLSQDKSAYKTDKKPLNKTTWFFHRVIDLIEKQKKTPKEILATLALVPTLPIQEEKASYMLASFFRDNEASLAEKLPSVSIVMFIRNIPSTPTLVNHMGFILKKEGKLYLNHAPQAKPWHVQEVLLDDYFTDMDSHRAPIEGLLILKPGE